MGIFGKVKAFFSRRTPLQRAALIAAAVFLAPASVAATTNIFYGAVNLKFESGSSCVGTDSGKNVHTGTNCITSIAGGSNLTVSAGPTPVVAVTSAPSFTGLVNFLASTGSGYTLQGLVPEFNVLTYGAQRTLTFDSTTTIQNAINDAEAQTATTATDAMVKIPAGRYVICGTGLTINQKNVVIFGPGAHFIACSHTSTPSVCALDPCLTAPMITIIYDSTHQGQNQVVYGLRFDGGLNATLANNPSQDAIEVVAGHNTRFADINCSFVNGFCIHYTDNPNYPDPSFTATPLPSPSPWPYCNGGHRYCVGSFTSFVQNIRISQGAGGIFLDNRGAQAGESQAFHASSVLCDNLISASNGNPGGCVVVVHSHDVQFVTLDGSTKAGSDTDPFLHVLGDAQAVHIDNSDMGSCKGSGCGNGIQIDANPTSGPLYDPDTSNSPVVNIVGGNILASNKLVQITGGQALFTGIDFTLGGDPSVVDGTGVFDVEGSACGVTLSGSEFHGNSKSGTTFYDVYDGANAANCGTVAGGPTSLLRGNTFWDTGMTAAINYSASGNTGWAGLNVFAPGVTAYNTHPPTFGQPRYSVNGTCASVATTGTVCTFPRGFKFPDTTYICPSILAEGATAGYFSYDTKTTTTVKLYSNSGTPTADYTCEEF